VQWHTPVAPVTVEAEQEGSQEFNTSLGNIARPYLPKKKKKELTFARQRRSIDWVCLLPLCTVSSAGACTGCESSMLPRSGKQPQVLGLQNGEVIVNRA
jgi:hypothetical protein